MQSLTVDCDTFSNEEKVAVVAPEASVLVEVTCSNAMLALIFLHYIANGSDNKIERS